MSIYCQYLLRHVSDTARSEQQLGAHANARLNERAKSFKKLTAEYNNCIEKMQNMKRKGNAPPGVQIPVRIDHADLFKIDVDDNIWLTTGLVPTDGRAPLRWSAEPKFREGIRMQLERDRVEEEESRLGWERGALQGWFKREWDSVIHAKKSAGECFFAELLRSSNVLMQTS